MEAVKPDAYCVNAGGTGSGRARRRSSDNVNRRRAVVILAHIHKRNTGKGFHSLSEVVLCVLVIASTASGGTNLKQHIAVHQQHRDIAIHSVNKLVKLIDKSIAVAVQLSAVGQVNVGGELVGGTGKSLFQTVKCVNNITSAGRRRGTVDNEIVEIVAGRLDLLLRLESQLVNSSGGVLQYAVNLKGTAHDNRLSGLFYALSFTCGIFGVNSTNSSGGGCLQLDIAIGQSGTASARRDGVIKHQSVQQQRTAAKFVNDHLIDLVGHTDLSFSKSNSHV